VYVISVSNPKSVSRGILSMTVDGVVATGGWIHLLDDGARHVVDVVLGTMEPRSGP
jgi:hypothetical protein